MALTVKHYLNVYQTRLDMQNEGITNPSNEIKIFTKNIVNELSKLKLDDTIDQKREKENSTQFVHIESGNVIAVLPDV